MTLEILNSLYSQKFYYYSCKTEVLCLTFNIKIITKYLFLNYRNPKLSRNEEDCNVTSLFTLISVIVKYRTNTSYE